ncbi:interleukin-34 [Chanos chanos]|uniref:Interleukin-34 n=1 Tax=Chanos chanos TaxID=29144 RepID=A0A6J2URN4_CHACN|nr:interleukin-34 [Chanos chanos]
MYSNGDMFWSRVGLLLAVLGFMCVLPVWTVHPSGGLCVSLETLREKLSSSLRRRYMKQNFPINYTVKVRYEEVFRLHNISRLQQEEGVLTSDLQDLWLMVNQEVVKKVLRVLPERHPTRHRYLTELEKLFRMFQQNYDAEVKKDTDEERELPVRIQNIWDRLSDRDYKGWRSVTPKSLLDNCYRTMHCLFQQQCFRDQEGEYDYCSILHWRKGKREIYHSTTQQPTTQTLPTQEPQPT